MERTCLNCGWVHFGVTRLHAEENVKTFNEYFKTLKKSEQKEFYSGKKASIDLYEHCHRCDGPYTNFRDSKPDECPVGSTMGPIIVENKHAGGSFDDFINKKPKKIKRKK